MVRLFFILCSVANPTACQRVDPLYDPMPVLTCNMAQLGLYAQWAQEHPFILKDKQFRKAKCIRLSKIDEGA